MFRKIIQVIYIDRVHTFFFIRHSVIIKRFSKMYLTVFVFLYNPSLEKTNLLEIHENPKILHQEN